MAGRFDQKKNAEQGEEKSGPEVESLEQEGPEREAPTAQAQAQLGNAALAAVLADRQVAGDATAGTIVDTLHEAERELEGPDHGGEDDPVDVGPLTEVDLSHSWRPRGTRRKKDKEPDPKRHFRDPMPTDDLPEEEAGFLAALRRSPAPTPVAERAVADSLIQPSVYAVVSALGDWAAATTRWYRPDPLDAALAHAVRSRPPALQDAGGRTGIGRARLAAMASWGLVRGPSLMERPRPATAALVQFCLELEARALVARNVVATFEPPTGKPPSAAELYASHVSCVGASLRPARMVAAALRPLAIAVASLQDLEEPRRLVPRLQAQEAPAASEEDPLGLDAVFGKPPHDPADAAYRSARLAAERLARAATATSVHAAGAAVAAHQVMALWSRGAPDATLKAMLGQVDEDVLKVLRLLVEIARAASARSVELRGLRNGLSRAARQISRARVRSIGMLAEVVAGILPPGPTIQPIERASPTPLHQALTEGRPQDAIPWAEAQPPGPERDTLRLLLELGMGTAPEPLHRPLHETWRDVRAARLPDLAGMLAPALSSCLLRCGRARPALEVARASLAEGRRRRNGLVVAEATLSAMMAHHQLGDSAAAHRSRQEGGSILWHMGARGPLTLLLRWEPATPEHEAAEA